MQIDSLRGRPEDPEIRAGQSYKFVDWRPTDSRAPCCGAMCEPCEAGSSDWWCDGAEVCPVVALAALYLCLCCDLGGVMALRCALLLLPSTCACVVILVGPAL